MKRETILKIKSQIKTLLPAIESAIPIFVSKELFTAIHITIQNASVDTFGTFQYSHNKEVEELEQVYNFLHNIQKYHSNYHFIVYIIDEFKMIYDGLKLSEDYE